MAVNVTDVKDRKNDWLSSKDVIRGLGVIKATESKCRFGYEYALPGGTTTRSKATAKRWAEYINFQLVNKSK